MARDFKYLETKLIHAGEPEPRIQGAVSMPIFQSSTFEYAGETSHDDLRYIRLNNTPNHDMLSRKLAALENAEAAIVTGSGMAGISTALQALLSPGDHLLAQECLYGGTREFITRDLASVGIGYDFIAGDDPDAWKRKLRPRTRAILVESITNPLLQVADLQGIIAFAKDHNLLSMIDNTFASPVNFRPPEQGFDLSFHSCTKYLNGHTDIVGGAVIGRRHLVEQVADKLNRLGGCMDPHACFLLHRGLKTLALRVRFQNSSAFQIAEFLEAHPRVRKVYYPGIPSHAGHRYARELFEGFGGMLSFEPEGGLGAARRFIQNTTIPIIAPSLGGVETLITRPVTTSHYGMPPAELEKLGITDSLVRISVGIEAPQELMEDFEQALEKA